MGIRTILLPKCRRTAFILCKEDSTNNALYSMLKAFISPQTSLQYFRECCSSLVKYFLNTKFLNSNFCTNKM